MIKVGIVGGAGYTGIELLRILLRHPNVTIKYVTSREFEGQNVSKVFANLIGNSDLVFTSINIKKLKNCNVVFFATPHGVAMKYAEELLKNGIKVIDLSADFRIKDNVVWSEYYNMQHTNLKLLAQAVYGLPEIFREDIKNANLIANPGCYPTSVLLGLKPLLEGKYIKLDNIIADCKSGASGAGKNANVHLCENSENFKAYNVAKHRHYPEIKQGLEYMAKDKVNITFVPHLLPMIRGIHSTLYVDLIEDINVQKLFEKAYENEYFINILEQGIYPQTKSVKASNFCQISIEKQKNSNKVIILVAEDNLVKGASGQAVQNMNIMFGLNETTGLEQLSVML